MRGFEDKDVVLSYAESMRIDEANRIISDDCRDWMLAVSKLNGFIVILMTVRKK